MSPDVIVIGAGAIGTSIAFQLAKAGLKVMVFERGRVGGEATGASAGMIQLNPDRGTPPTYAALSTESARLFSALAAELLERTGIDIGYRRAPLLHVTLDEAEEARLRGHRAWQLDHGMTVGWLDGAAALDLEPALNPAVRAALLYQDHYQVLPRALAQALARAATDLGAVVREGAAVDRLLTQGDRVIGVALGSETIRSAETVAANGAWASAWAEALHTPIPVRPVRGQMVGLSTTATPLRHAISSSSGYILTKDRRGGWVRRAAHDRRGRRIAGPGSTARAATGRCHRLRRVGRFTARHSGRSPVIGTAARMGRNRGGCRSLPRGDLADSDHG